MYQLVACETQISVPLTINEEEPVTLGELVEYHRGHGLAHLIDIIAYTLIC